MVDDDASNRYLEMESSDETLTRALLEIRYEALFRPTHGFNTCLPGVVGEFLAGEFTV